MTDGLRCPQHPDAPAAGTCSRCGTPGCPDCLERLGDQWACAGCRARHASLPWDDRGTLGVRRAWWRTCVALLFRPRQTLAGAAPGGSMGGSMLFVALCALAGYGPAVLALPVVSFALVASDGQTAALGAMLGLAVLFVFFLGLAVFVHLVAAFLLARNDRLLLYFVRAPPTGGDVTLRAEALACAPLACGLVPFLGLGVGLVWWGVLRVLAVRALHRLTGAQAALVVLLPIALVVVLMGGALAVALAVGVSGR